MSVASLLALLALAFAPASLPDPGMWTFDNLPLEHLKKVYGFEPTPAWIDHVRLSSVRVSSGGSGSFVSPRGLVMTNHHVALEFINGLSTEERDLAQLGYHARTQEEELRCPGANLRQLLSIKDVTDRVEAAAAGMTNPAQAAQARATAMDEIAKSLAASSGMVVDVVTLYGGAKYHAYGYKVYDDVRLVFAPEMRAAYFGGDWDNFCYPRWCLDATFLRAYENGEPADTSAHYFKWSASGPSENELVFVSGNPGSTARLWPQSRLAHERDYYNPAVLGLLERREKALSRYAALGAGQQIKVLDELFGVRNSLKAYTGHQQGLKDPELWGRKEAAQEAFLKDAGGDAEVAEALAMYEKSSSARNRVVYNLIFQRVDGELGALARQFRGFAEQVSLSESERQPPFREDNLDKVRAALSKEMSFDRVLERERLAANFDNAVDMLGPDSEYVQVLGGRRGYEAADWVLSQTQLLDADKRAALVNGDPKAILESSDPLLRLAGVIAAERTPAVASWQEAESVETEAAAALARARFRVYGDKQYPDATFTLRLTYGTCKGYELGTTQVPWTTTLYGLFDRSASMSGREPFDLPPTWEAARSKLDLATPYNFVSTCDIIGGNSGSPVINKNLEIVGLIFDGNIQSLPNRYLYLDDVCRSVSVHSEGIEHALERVYKAYGLLAELGAR